MSNETFLYYCPSKSQSHAHIVRSKDHAGTAKQLQALAENFSAWRPAEGDSFEIWLGTSLGTMSLAARLQLVEKISAAFGERNPAFPLNAEEDHVTFQWKVPAAALPDFFEFYKKNYHSDLRICYSYKLEWKDLSRSYGLLVMQLFDNKFLVSVHLHFPYQLSDSRLLPFIAAFNAALPFALSEKNFRYTITNKSGNNFSYRKIDTAFIAVLKEILKKDRA